MSTSITHTCDVSRFIIYNAFRLLAWIILLCILRGLIDLFLIIRDIRRIPPGGERTFEKQWVIRIGWPSTRRLQFEFSYQLHAKKPDSDSGALADVV
ncbi:hypothetical protein BJV78DRAFT_1284983 [Lactifluus subvellereus]|nr:hypothetical protein BJV78DRAFT_1284983 [Lactifluus subvellereus]